MNRTKIKKLALLGLFCGILCSVVASGGGVSAVDKNSIVSKGALEGLKTCLGSGAFGASWQASNLKKGFVINDGSSDAVKFPYGWSNAENNNASCREIMFGGYGGSALIPSNILQSNDTKEIAQFFAGNSLDGSGGVGYTATAIGSETDGQGHQLKLKLVSTKDQCNGNTPAMSLNGTLVSEIVFPVIAKTASGNSITIGSGDYNVPAPGSRGVAEFLTTCSVMPIVVKDVGTTSKPSYLISSESGSGEKTIKTKIDKKQGAIYTNVSSNIKISLGKPKAIFEPNQLAVDVGGGGFANDYKIQWDGSKANDLYVGFNAKNGAGYGVSGLVDYNSLALSRQETYDLYKYYLKDVFKASIICEGESNYDMYKNETPINWKAGAQCRLYNTGSVAKPKNVYGVNHSYHLNKEITLDDIVITLASLGDLSSLEGSNEGGIISGPSIPTPTPQPTPSPTPGEGSTGGAYDCDSIQTADGKIGAMQWILCPSLDNTRYTASWIDEKIEEWVSVDSTVYSNDAVKSVWDAIRNIADVAMIVFLMVIIFSQLTGYGIDNYGIKKMLPRLIVMAILVNLSLYICQIAADLSNIIGVGLRDMFASVGGEASSGLSGTDYLGGAMVGVFSAAANAGAATAAGFAAFSITASVATALIVVFIVLFLIILVALLVFSLMLGARQIIVILCIILSPLAFVAFILPNTQNLFKKWWDLFKAALIIFPICGAMSGISYLLRSMRATGEIDFGIGGGIIMIILPYLVFFLLPTLLKNALSALGKVGGALTSMGQTIRNGGRAIGQAGMKVAQNTETYKNWQNEAARNRQAQSSQRTIDRLEAIKKQREASGGQLNERETRQLARAHEVQRKLGSENAAARTILTEREYAGKSMEDLVSDWNDAFDAGDTERMNALTNVITSRHGPGGVNNIASKLAEKDIFVQNPNGIDADHPDGMAFRNDAMKNSFNALQTNMMQNSSLANAMQNKASDIYQMISGSGYVDGKRQNAVAHSANNGVATQTKDWATQSSATLKRAIDAGQLTAQDAQNLLTSTDPTIQSGLQSDKGKREVLQAAAAGYRSSHNGAWDKDTIKGADGKDVQMARVYAENYQHNVNKAEQAELDVRAAEAERAREQANNIRDIRDMLGGRHKDQQGPGVA